MIGGCHRKVDCGRGVAVLDPELLATLPKVVAAATALDAMTHAVETAATNARNETSRALSVAAWERVSGGFDAFLERGEDAFRMLVGAHLAGAAIERSMLGAAHSCANPLTARYDIVHGVAVGLLLPHVVRFNAAGDGNPYADLGSVSSLLESVGRMQASAAIPVRLRDLGVEASALPDMAEQAAAQWTAQFNPRPVRATDLLGIYEAAF